MFLIFGVGKDTKEDFGAAVPVVCPNCNNATDLHLIKIKKWFALFFLSIFPYRSDYYLMCKICSRGVRLTDQQAERAKRLVRATRAFRKRRVSEERYNDIVRQSKILNRVKRLAPPKPPTG